MGGSVPEVINDQCSMFGILVATVGIGFRMLDDRGKNLQDFRATRL